jgi:amidohydrolase
LQHALEILCTEANDLFEYTRGLRRDFHKHPELGFQEVRTAEIVARELRSLGLEVSTGIAETGVVVMLEGTRPGKVTLVRFDMDALPIQEETGAEYASQSPGRMHACGHDGHLAIGLTVARLLLTHRHELAGGVKLVFQPAEEGLGGAGRMIAEGVLENPRPDYALGVHMWNERPLGWLGLTPGPVMAGAEIFSVRLTGKGGHGANPHMAIDPLLAAGHTIVSLQSIVSRNISPLQTAVVTVAALHGGEAFNIIPSQAEMRGTIRTFEEPVRRRVIERFEQIVNGTAQTFDCQAEIDLKNVTQAVVNDPWVTEQVQAVARLVLPDSRQETDYRSVVSEDMALILEEIPGCYILVGSANSQKGLDAPHHHPRFDFDEQAMPRAAALVTAAALQLNSFDAGKGSSR